MLYSCLLLWASSKAIAGESKDWDKLLPYLLFAYREVPQASTGFASFELSYSRSVCRALDLVQEAWEADTRSCERVIPHVLSMQEKLAKMTELLRENLSQAQNNQKK